MDRGAPFTDSYPATAETVPRVRAELTALAREAGANDEALEAIRLAASEALSNAVLHAYAGGPGEVHVTAAVAGDELWVLIADDGLGLSAGRTSPGLGMGLALMACMADHFSVLHRAAGGTEIQMRFGIGAARTGTRAGDSGSARAASRARGHARGSAVSASAPA